MAASLAEVAMESQQDDHPIDVTPAGGYGFGGVAPSWPGLPKLSRSAR
jgi:hypothetical protein